MKIAIMTVLIAVIIIWAIHWLGKHAEEVDFERDYDSKHDNGDVK